MSVETLGFSKRVQRTFHDTSYEVTLSGDGDSLHVGVENLEDGRRWRAKFAANFIEEITKKTGNAKTFDVFVKMALSALTQESESVYLDVLTARDLDMLRRHANPQGPPTTSSSSAGQSDKRYVILTYCAEFDKVHYPLPLPLEASCDEETLRKLVARLRSELVDARSTIAAFEQQAPGLQTSHQDIELKQRLSALERQNAELSDTLRITKKELEQARADVRPARGLEGTPGFGGAASPAPGGPGGAVRASSASTSAEVQKLRDTCSKLQAELKTRKEEARQHPLALKRVSEQAARDLRAERQKVDRLEKQVKKLEEEKRALSSRAAAAVRSGGDRSRPSSRSPSVERSRPPSRVASNASTSRASSVRSSRERTPSPSTLRSNRVGTASWRAGSPGGTRKPPSPGSKIASPYSVPQSAARRTPSPGQRGRERTPSPGARRQGPSAVAPPIPDPRPAALSLRERRGASGNVGSSSLGDTYRQERRAPGRPVAGYDRRSNSASVSRATAARANGSVQGVADNGGPHSHLPGSLFGLAANLGLGTAPPPPVAAAAASSDFSAADAEGCDIDARLQALQSFLKQTKAVGS